MGLFLWDLNTVILIEMFRKDKIDLLEKLVKSYAEIIAGLPRKEYIEYVEQHKVDYGVCFHSKHVFGVNIYSELWIEKYSSPNHIFWDMLPGNANTYTECKRRLKTRLINLKTELRIEKSNLKS